MLMPLRKPAGIPQSLSGSHTRPHIPRLSEVPGLPPNDLHSRLVLDPNEYS
jgi:hypothetical protein